MVTLWGRGVRVLHDSIGGGGTDDLYVSILGVLGGVGESRYRGLRERVNWGDGRSRGW